MTAQFQPGDRVKHAQSASAVGTVRSIGNDSAQVRWDGNGEYIGLLPLDYLHHVPVTAEHVGQYGRVVEGEGKGAVGLITAWRGDGVVRVEDPDGIEWAAPAVLVAEPPVPVVPAPTGPTDCGKCRDVDRWRDKPTEHMPVAPAPDQDDEPEQWRVGEHYGIHVYEVGEVWNHDEVDVGEKADDRPVATFHRPADAALAVERVNAHAALTARAEQAEAEVARLRDEVADEMRWHDRARRSKDILKAERNAARSERDAARAELAAANTTDGLGLPDIDAHRVQVWLDGDLLLASYDGIQCDSVQARGTYSGPRSLREIAATSIALANARARLAQEAPTTKDGE